MKFDAAYIQRISRETGFDAINLEKVLRLKRLLIEFDSHPFLKDRLLLKGGTALNLFYLELLRLSVDIDLNYIGALDREAMLQERVELAKHIEQICGALNYRTQRGVDEHALIEWYLGYQSHIGTFNQVQVEVNFLMRTCALPPKVRAAAPMVDAAACAFSILAVEELLAGKLKAMIQRQHPRDLYDLYRFVGRGTPHDAELLRKLTVLFCSTLDRDFRTYEWARFGRIDDEDVKRFLYPLLRADDRPTAAEMMAVAEPLLRGVLDHKREKGYLDRIASGTYAPELLFPGHPEIAERIRQHPALVGRRRTWPIISQAAARRGESGCVSQLAGEAGTGSSLFYQVVIDLSPRLMS